MSGLKKNKSIMKSSNSPLQKIKKKLTFCFLKKVRKLRLTTSRKWLKEAEKGPFQTQEEFDRDIDEWLSQEIFKK